MPIPDKPSYPFAEASAWLGRVAAMAIVMVLPIVGGQYLDESLGIQVLGPIGVLIGLTLGLVYLLAITGVFRKNTKRSKRGSQNDGQPPERTE